jgi:hypothetical protein
LCFCERGLMDSYFMSFYNIDDTLMFLLISFSQKNNFECLSHSFFFGTFYLILLIKDNQVIKRLKLRNVYAFDFQAFLGKYS